MFLIRYLVWVCQLIFRLNFCSWLVFSLSCFESSSLRFFSLLALYASRFIHLEVESKSDWIWRIEEIRGINCASDLLMGGSTKLAIISLIMCFRIWSESILCWERLEKESIYFCFPSKIILDNFAHKEKALEHTIFELAQKQIGAF